jgi:uncharacterized protein
MGVRAFLDSNVLVSGLAFPLGLPGTILRAAGRRRFTIVSCEYVLEEVDRTLARLGSLSVKDRHSALQVILELSEIVEPPLHPPKVRDPRDSVVLGTAIVHRVDYQVTGDKDLLEHPPVEGLRIVRPRAFAEALRLTTSSR